MLYQIHRCIFLLLEGSPILYYIGSVEELVIGVLVYYVNEVSNYFLGSDFWHLLDDAGCVSLNLTLHE